jgi:hypothetical protein
VPSQRVLNLLNKPRCRPPSDGTDHPGLMSAPCGDPDAAMNEQDEKPGQKPDGSYGVSTEELDVRATMELTRQALEASGAEVERSKRLLREGDRGRAAGDQSLDRARSWHQDGRRRSVSGCRRSCVRQARRANCCGYEAVATAQRGGLAFARPVGSPASGSPNPVRAHPGERMPGTQFVAGGGSRS